MKESGLWLSLLLASLVSASAQVTVEVTQDQQQFLPGESLPVAVRITNRSGQTLHLGTEDDWLTFSIEGSDGMVVPKLADVPVAGAFDLDSSKVAIKRLDLAPYFSLGQPGRYSILATVRVKNWDHDLVSRPKGFTVIQGAKLWEQEFGLPQPAGATNTQPEVRKYMLQQANYLRGQLRLYLRVTDSLGVKTFRVYPIGPMISFGRPEAQLDAESDLHVLYQNGPTTFSYTAFNPDGQLLIRQTYAMSNTRPHLREDVQGHILVHGGEREESDTDVPAPTTASAGDDQHNSAPGAEAVPKGKGEPKTPQS